MSICRPTGLSDTPPQLVQRDSQVYFVQLILLNFKRSLEKDLSFSRPARPSNTPGEFVQGDGQLQIVCLQFFLPDTKGFSADAFRLPRAARLCYFRICFNGVGKSAGHFVGLICMYNRHCGRMHCLIRGQTLQCAVY